MCMPTMYCIYIDMCMYCMYTCVCICDTGGVLEGGSGFAARVLREQEARDWKFDDNSVEQHCGG
jgi:hypothetical protein